MASVSTYLNFDGNTEEAFNFYKSVFGNEFDGNSFTRMGDVPVEPGQPELSDESKNKIMHVSLETIAGHRIMGTDAPDREGYSLTFGNNVYINLEPDSKEEVDKLFAGLSQGGKIEMEPKIMFWGDYWGACIDKFGVQWMFNFAMNQKS